MLERPEPGSLLTAYAVPAARMTPKQPTSMQSYGLKERGDDGGAVAIDT